MAKIIIEVPAEQATEYLAEIINQIESGCTSGHWDRDTHWEVADWGSETPKTLK
ncbi:hypothetical protein [Gordonia sihwensis]|uniref:hypothetical protein n=1 Tax=Gordonia sihwensis TaxID=173559 RepID=UPI003D9857B3